MSNAGIYKIINLKNNKCYVGSSINLKSRKYKHFKDLSNGTHHNLKLQRAYDKYGEENFNWEIIEYVDKTNNLEIFKNNILAREQYWINELNSYEGGYNILPTAGSRLGSKSSEETKKKIGEANRISLLGNTNGSGRAGVKFTKEHIDKLRESHLGNRHSEESKEKISSKLRGRKVSEETRKKIGLANSISLKGKTLSEETRKKISDKNKGHEVSEETRKKIGEKHRGKTISKEHIEKIREANTGRKMSEKEKEHLRNFWKGRVLTEEHKQKIRDSRRKPEHNNTGMVWVTDGVNNKLIRLEFMDDYISRGFARGRVIPKRIIE